MLLLVSCSSPRYYIYAPTVPVNPFFKEKGESKISAYISGNSGAHLPGADLQAAYALTQHFALSGSFSSSNEKDNYYNSEPDDSYTTEQRYRRRTAEIGAGYFAPLNEKKSVSFNLYGGYGWGRFTLRENGKDANSNDYYRTHESGIGKWYLQPSIHLMPGRVFRMGLVTRLTLLQYGHINTSYSPDELSQRELNLVANNNYIFVEPTMNFQIAFPNAHWAKLDMGLTFCPSLRAIEEDYTRLRNRGFLGSIGLTFDLSKLKR